MERCVKIQTLSSRLKENALKAARVVFGAGVCIYFGMRVNPFAFIV